MGPFFCFTRDSFLYLESSIVTFPPSFTVTKINKQNKLIKSAKTFIFFFSRATNVASTNTQTKRKRGASALGVLILCSYRRGGAPLVAAPPVGSPLPCVGSGGNRDTAAVEEPLLLLLCTSTDGPSLATDVVAPPPTPPPLLLTSEVRVLEVLLLLLLFPPPFRPLRGGLGTALGCPLVVVAVPVPPWGKLRVRGVALLLVLELPPPPR